MKLLDIAHSRTGDKGNISNISSIPPNPLVKDEKSKSENPACSSI